MPEPLDSYHSEEAQEILGRIPSWIVRWGITVIGGLLMLFVIGSCFIRYPERINATITLTSRRAPVSVVARNSGEVEVLWVSNNKVVRAGEKLAVIRSGAQYHHVLQVDSCLASAAWRAWEEVVLEQWIYAPNLHLGDIQSDWAAFSGACLAYKDYMENHSISIKKQLISEQIDKQKIYLTQLGRQQQVMKEDFDYEEKRFRRDSLLLSRKMMTPLEYEESYRSRLQAHNSLLAFEAQITSAELQLLTLEQQLVTLDMQEREEVQKLVQAIDTERERLVAQLSLWKTNYLLTAPTTGVISFVNKWDPGQFILSGESLLWIVPTNEPEDVLGIIQIPQEGLGRVHPGQKVNVRLNGYPYMEYGPLVGQIDYIAAVPLSPENTTSSPHYTATVIFPNSLHTTYGKEITLIQKMEGQAQIITQNRRLIMRFLDPIVDLITNGM